MIDRRKRLFSDQNPFSTSAVKPGAIEFQFLGEVSAGRLLSRLQKNEWRGEIVGPHGSGKSTLLRTLIPAIRDTGRQVRHFIVGVNERQLPPPLGEHTTWTESVQVVVEGFELLTRRHRKLLDRMSRERRAGLLVACHKPQGFPTLFRTSVTFDLAISLVNQLLPLGCDLITRADVKASFLRHGPNLRELLFEMYDLYEHRRRESRPRMVK